MMEIGILGYGVYIPKRRLQRYSIYDANAWFAPSLKGLSRGERAIANWDEDTITMGVEAAREALMGMDRNLVSRLSLASTTLPYLDRMNSGVIKEALNLSDDVASADVTGSQRAATSELIRALQANDAGNQLCIAAETRKARPASEAELIQGDAAAAIVVGHGDPIARLLGTRSVTVDFVDHYRAEGETFDYGWENRWIREEGYLKLLGGSICSALDQLGISGDEIDHTVIPIAGRGAAAAIAHKAGLNSGTVADTLDANIGDAGAAHPLLMLAAAFDQAKPGEKILLAGFGQGADVSVFETTEAIAKIARARVTKHLHSGQSDTNYNRFLFHRGLLKLDCGMRAEQDQKQPGSALYRNRKTVLGLIGSKSTASGTVQFPRSTIGVSSTSVDTGVTQDYPLADILAKVVTFTADNLTYSPDPPCYYGMIDFEGGGRMTAEFTDVEPDTIEVGQSMRMVFRIKAIDEQRHFKRYFWKATVVA